MRELFMKQLEDLEYALSQMGEAIVEAIRETVIALREMDKEKAEKLIEGDAAIDHMEKEIESKCLRLLLQQTPVAGDLRKVSAALKMITDLERIGDHASDISEIILSQKGTVESEALYQLQKMADITSKMVQKSIQAYRSQNIDEASEISEMDDTIDELFVQVKELIGSQIATSKEKGMEELDLFMIAKYFERIGDHAENIGEWVVFSINGKHKNERVI